MEECSIRWLSTGVVKPRRLGLSMKPAPTAGTLLSAVLRNRAKALLTELVLLRKWRSSGNSRIAVKVIVFESSIKHNGVRQNHQRMVLFTGVDGTGGMRTGPCVSDYHVAVRAEKILTEGYTTHCIMTSSCVSPSNACHHFSHGNASAA
jgi:hypothetical protein